MEAKLRAPIYITLTEVVKWMYRITCLCALHRCTYFFAVKIHSARECYMVLHKSDMAVLNHVPCYTTVTMSHPISTAGNKCCMLSLHLEETENPRH